MAAGRAASGIAKSWVTIALLGVVLVGFGLVEFNAVQDRINHIDSPYRNLASVGVGLWMIIGGVVVEPPAGLVEAINKSNARLARLFGRPATA